MNKESAEHRGCCAPSAGLFLRKDSKPAPCLVKANLSIDLPPAPVSSGTSKAACCHFC